MTAVIRLAEARCRASMVINCSMMWKLIGWLWLCITKQSAPRTLSVEADVDLAVGEDRPLEPAEPDAQQIGDFFGQRLIGATGEQHQPFAAYDFHGLLTLLLLLLPSLFAGSVAADLFLFGSLDGQRPGGTSWVITDPAPVNARRPRSSTGATSIVSEPMKARSPILVGCL